MTLDSFLSLSCLHRAIPFYRPDAPHECVKTPDLATIDSLHAALWGDMELLREELQGTLVVAIDANGQIMGAFRQDANSEAIAWFFGNIPVTFADADARTSFIGLDGQLSTIIG